MFLLGLLRGPFSSDELTELHGIPHCSRERILTTARNGFAATLYLASSLDKPPRTLTRDLHLVYHSFKRMSWVPRPWSS